MENNFYVYGHYIAGSDLPFYVGKGSGRRAYHKYDRSKFWHSVVDKYGGYEVKLLYENLTDAKALEKEISLIKKYGRRDISTGILVNQTDGGDGVHGHSDISKKKISDTHLGKPLNEEHRYKISKANTGRVVTAEARLKIRNAFLGKKRPYEVIEKMRASMTGKNGTKILQFDLNNNFIKEYNSITEAAKENGFCYSSIRRVLKGQLRSTKKFTFRYK